MEKTYSKIMMLSVAFMISMVSFAETKINGVYYNLDGSNNQAQVTYNESAPTASYSYSGAVTIPQVVIYDGKEYSVTSIGEEAFLENRGLTSVSIPNSVKSIGDKAFYGCSALTSVTIPNSVTTIGEGAFSGCDALTAINIPGSVESIGMGAFSSCNALASIIVDKDNTVYDSRGGCNAIVMIANNMLIAGCKGTIIPNTVSGIGACAFYGCQSLTNITIPNSVRTIGGNAFALCYGLSSINIPESVISIGRGAFMLCSSLSSVTINGANTSIMSYAFDGCRSVSSVKVVAQNPPAIDNMTFEVYNELHVPAAVVKAYQVADYWKKFRIVGDKK
jgi:hypothetical protein